MPRAPIQRLAQVLLVEDNPGDVRLTREAFKDSQIVNELFVVGDGVQALEYLRGENGYAHAPKPDLILLDLNLPKKDGREVLAEIKNDVRLSYIPVVVLTTSSAEQDVLRSYELAANCYVTKPIEFDQFVEVVRSIHNFWFSTVTLPVLADGL
jgi:two-component system response regulator